MIPFCETKGPRELKLENSLNNSASLASWPNSKIISPKLKKPFKGASFEWASFHGYALICHFVYYYLQESKICLFYWYATTKMEFRFKWYETGLVGFGKILIRKNCFMKIWSTSRDNCIYCMCPFMTNLPQNQKVGETVIHHRIYILYTIFEDGLLQSFYDYILIDAQKSLIC